jgi:hypothetical protein
LEYCPPQHPAKSDVTKAGFGDDELDESSNFEREYIPWLPFTGLEGPVAPTVMFCPFLHGGGLARNIVF